MKTHVFKKNIFITAVLAALCACLLPQNSIAQTQPAPDDSAQSSASDTLPADILPSSPLAQVIKLAQAGVGESVMLTYINNSSSRFNLTSDQIIYLKDIGLPDDAVTAMMQRDQQLGAITVAQTPPPATETATVQPVFVTQNYFYDTLSPYGGWVEVEGYGRCWRPTVVIYDSSWQPYCNHGHWIYTDAGWYWVSDYSWGSCAFHYGRWFHDARFGWCWWPDTAWAPSWVAWRYSDDYCGWVPLPPRCVYREGVGIFYNGVAVSAGFDFGISVNFFTFVPVRNFCDPHPERFRVSRARTPVIYNQTTIINNFNVNTRDHTVINAGIAPEHIAAVSRTPVPRATIHETSAPGRHGEQLSRDEIIVHRPHFNNADPAAPLHQNTLPRPVPASRPNTPRPPAMNENRNNPNNPNSAPHNPTPPQNNFSQPDKFSHPDRNLPSVQKPPENRIETPRENGSPHQRPDNISPPTEKNNPPPAQAIPPENRRAAPPAMTQPRQPEPQPRIVPPENRQAPVAPPSAPQPRQYEPPPRVVPPENRQTPVAPPIERPRSEPRPNYSEPPQRSTPSMPPPQQPQHNFNPRQNDLSPGDSRPGRAGPPPAQPPAAPSAQQPAQKNSGNGKQDKNQNGQQQ